MKALVKHAQSGRSITYYVYAESFDGAEDIVRRMASEELAVPEEELTIIISEIPWNESITKKVYKALK